MPTRYSHYAEVVGDGGLVTGPDQLIADAGAAALAAGGNAVDAAVAAAFATGVVEPPMSGVGGGATMTIALRDPDRIVVVSGQVAVPLDATPEHYPIDAEKAAGGWAFAFSDWPPVVGHVNIYGAKSVAVPGAVACLCAAHERFGRLPLDKVLEPAIALAADGVELNWFIAGFVASEARSLARDPGCAEVLLPRGYPLHAAGVRRASRLVQPRLAETLQAIAAKGPDAFYHGAIAESLAGVVREAGGLLGVADLQGYRPVIEEPLAGSFGRFTLYGEPVSGLPTVLEALYLYDAAVRADGDGREGEGPHDDAVAWARAFRLAFGDRFTHMSRDAGVPWEGLRSRKYARALLHSFLENAPAPRPHEFSGEAEAVAPAGRPARGGRGLTSQMAAVDREGNMVSLTQTVLNAFGARVLDPRTGVLLNNGIGYFDPRPGSPHSVRPGALAFSAMTPLILCDDGGPVAAVGASGGRRIISGVAQIVAALAAGGVSLQDACEGPWIHTESDAALLDVRWPAGTAESLEEAGFTVEPAEDTPTVGNFARPGGVMIGPDGRRRSGLDPTKPGGAAAV